MTVEKKKEKVKKMIITSVVTNIIKDIVQQAEVVVNADTMFKRLRGEDEYV